MRQVAAADGQIQRFGRACYIVGPVPVVMCVVVCATPPPLLSLPLSGRGPNDVPVVKSEVLDGRRVRGRETTWKLIGGGRM